VFQIHLFLPVINIMLVVTAAATAVYLLSAAADLPLLLLTFQFRYTLELAIDVITNEIGMSRLSDL